MMALDGLVTVTVPVTVRLKRAIRAESVMVLQLSAGRLPTCGTLLLLRILVMTQFDPVGSGPKRVQPVHPVHGMNDVGGCYWPHL